MTLKPKPNKKSIKKGSNSGKKLPESNAKIVCADSLLALPKLKKGSIRLAYIDPPFNTGKKMSYKKIKTVRDENGSRTGYGQQRYAAQEISTLSYNDKFDDYVPFIMDRVEKAYPLLTKDGSMFVHIDYREAHYLKIELDKVFGRENLINEIIWSYDYGARPKTKWPCKHDTILWFAVDKDNYVFNYDEIDRIPYMSPALVGAEKAEQGKIPTDVWWNSIIGTNSKEREAGRGYPTQKPLAILERIILAHSDAGDTVLDFFAGSGTTGIAALKHMRKAILIDNNPLAVDVIKKRINDGR